MGKVIRVKPHLTLEAIDVAEQVQLAVAEGDEIPLVHLALLRRK